MKEKLILIGASTGGPGHLKILLNALPNTLNTPIIIAQHMNAVFIPSFVQQFRAELKVPVVRANEPLHVNQGGVYICEKNCLLETARPLRLSFEEAPAQTLYNPSIDDLFLSAVPLCEKVDILAILLTGIGHDGAKGIQELHKAGAKCLGENEESAVVYGMPKRAKELVPELEMLPLGEIKQRIERFTHVFF
ncbi:chemotaxis protein CheB [Sulfurospirillum sp. T05]|uniref:protein-glutamate methylesterase n=1 Tax=Sulfurospirillum tamanense TaxID=2813362 RepID=A0ABS2WTV2_9BACT|nr:chemotaxis protein CheB [Sulfurospirillum tamanensis]